MSKPVAKPVVVPAPVVEAKVKRDTSKNNASLWATVDFKAQGAHIVRMVVKSNPKMAGKGPAIRFALYQDGMTLDAAIKAGVTEADVRWDVAHAYIALETPSKN